MNKNRYFNVIMALLAKVTEMTLIPLVCVIYTLTAESVASASCAGSSPKVVWSYPADGDIDVPINATFWIVSTIGDFTADLNGAELTGTAVSFGARSVQPNALAPNTDYLLRLTFPLAAREDAGVPEPVEIRFRTGSSQAVKPVLPVVGKRKLVMRSFDAIYSSYASHLCANVIATQDCFDTPYYDLIEFDVAEPKTIAWLIQSDYLGASQLWPESCKAPTLIIRTADQQRCFTISAVGPGGLLSDPVHDCSNAANDSDRAGCTISRVSTNSRSAWPFTAGLLITLTLRLRRRLRQASARRCRTDATYASKSIERE